MWLSEPRSTHCQTQAALNWTFQFPFICTSSSLSALSLSWKGNKTTDTNVPGCTVYTSHKLWVAADLSFVLTTFRHTTETQTKRERQLQQPGKWIKLAFGVLTHLRKSQRECLKKPENSAALCIVFFLLFLTFRLINLGTNKRRKLLLFPYLAKVRSRDKPQLGNNLKLSLGTLQGKQKEEHVCFNLTKTYFLFTFCDWLS